MNKPNNMFESVSINFDGIKRKKLDFLNSLEIQISPPTNSNKFYFICKNKLLNDYDINSIFWDWWPKDSSYCFDLDVAKSLIIEKVDEWIHVFNINEQSQELTNYLKSKSAKNFSDLLENTIKEKEILKNEFILIKEKGYNLDIEIEKLNLEIEDIGRCKNFTDTSFIDKRLELVLNNMFIPFCINKQIDWEYDNLSKSLIVNLGLPSPDEIYKFKSAFYKDFARKPKELTFVAYKDKEKKELYSSVIYKIQLDLVYNLFLCDFKNELEVITINGWVNHLDKSIGNYVDKCITSLTVTKNEFQKLNIDHVDPNLCFKNLKGISSVNLIDLLPVSPLITINRSDNRFVQNKNVIHEVNEGMNLTEMDWEDFEHLVRELFEKEFSVNGGEVKITQASRDGGVDAIAFDPDPIRGGKIVIQAKRYNNVVGVSAVRDLYGTTLNEGANKGILVTTSNYGSDAFEFAKGKPITLLNGGHLLSLLEKHGYKAQIRLRVK